MKPDWLSFQEALDTVVGAVTPLGPERRKLEDVLGGVLAEDIVAPIDLPRWTNSAMDGFAVRRSDVASVSTGNPIELPVVDDVAAGSFPRGPLPPGTAARVMTGATVPEGADSVIRVEHTDGGRDLGTTRARVTIVNDQDVGRNLRRRGEEISAGKVALPAGTVFSPGAIGVTASLGYSEVSTVRRPLVAVLTSGDELVEVDRFEEVRAGRKIVSSNSYSLAAQLTEAGCGVRYLGIASDSLESLRSALRRADGCDALVTSAGISVGEHDHIKTALLELRTEILFWRVRMRPGSPFAFGRVPALGGIPWFGLPGNPVSSTVTFELFARPALLRMSGRYRIFRRRLNARLLDDYVAAPGLTQFPRVRLQTDESGMLCARLTGAQGSGNLSSLAQADGLMVIPDDRPGGRTGDTFDVIPLSEGYS